MAELRRDKNESGSDLIEKIVYINRVAKVVKAVKLLMIGALSMSGLIASGRKTV